LVAPKYDPIQLGILWSRLIAIIDEAAATLHRTSFSPLVRDSNDFACVLLDAEGNALAQATLSAPAFLGTLPKTVKQLLHRYPSGSLAHGDVIICNDPWLGTGQLNDINIVLPIFHGDQLVAISASTAHAADIGGRLLSLENREIFEEGLRIPVSKLYEAGRLNETVLDWIRHNVRVPDQVVGDIAAQVSANELAATRIRELIAEYNLANLADLSGAIQAQSEAATRDAIRRLPAGTYRRKVAIEGFGDNSDIELSLTLTVDHEAGEITCDYTGTSPQQLAACNVVPHYAFALTAYGLKCVLAPEVPNNEGCLRPITVVAPEGSLLNPRFPASTGVRNLVGHHLPSLIFATLADAIPDRVLAGTGAPNWAVLLSGRRDDGRSVGGAFFYSGGMGAAASRDGLSAVCFPANASNTPIEVLEGMFPFRFTRRALLPDSGGPGRTNGGLGQVVEFDIVDAPYVMLSFWTSHTRHPANGLAGGGAGSLGKVLINGALVDTGRIQLVNRGDRVTLITPGGGAFGDPSSRSRDKVVADIRNGFITRDFAKRSYPQFSEEAIVSDGGTV
jgi:N-methylhydantoinase B